MPPVTTKTLGPLHHEDLEPRRFEDLVRQLIYDFRPWRMLEATGRAGSDDGFDVRGFEMVGPQPALEVDDDGERMDTEPGTPDRRWLVQCKREKAIGPTKLVGYLEAIPATERAGLHGIILAAACDFSKKARDAFREKAREMGVAEAHLWGKAEIEDQLFQPKNDYLLFAYFGFSLQTRRRSLKTELRAKLAMKRKCKKHLAPMTPALVRDPSDERYPYQDADRGLGRIDRGKWKPFRVKGCFHDGVHLVYRRQFGFIDDDGEHWDIAETMDDGPLHRGQDPWGPREREADWEARSAAMDVWSELPEHNRAWFELSLVLPYENILDIDEAGDEHFQGPHVFTTGFEGYMGPFRERYAFDFATTHQWDRRSCAAKAAARVERFTRKPLVEGEVPEPPEGCLDDEAAER